MHENSHPLAGATVLIKDGVLDPVQEMVVGGAEYRIEDWWDTLTGGSWQMAQGNIAAIQYALRVAGTGVPLDDEVVYGKIGGLGHLVHVSELSEVPVP
jgi:hypothetical protein